MCAGGATTTQPTGEKTYRAGTEATSDGLDRIPQLYFLRDLALGKVVDMGGRLHRGANDPPRDLEVAIFGGHALDFQRVA